MVSCQNFFYSSDGKSCCLQQLIVCYWHKCTMFLLAVHISVASRPHKLFGDLGFSRKGCLFLLPETNAVFQQKERIYFSSVQNLLQVAFVVLLITSVCSQFFPAALNWRFLRGAQEIQGQIFSYPCTFIDPSDFYGLSYIHSNECRVEVRCAKWSRDMRVTKTINDIHDRPNFKVLKNTENISDNLIE